MTSRKLNRLASLLVCIFCIFANTLSAQEGPVKQDANNVGIRAKDDSISKIRVGDYKIVLEYSFDAPIVYKSGEYHSVTLRGLDNHTKSGAPIVPVRPTKILVPYGKEVTDCQMTTEGVLELPDSFVLAPAQRQYPLSYRGPIERTTPDPAIYESNAPWPGKYYEKVGIQSKRGYQLLVLNLFPLQYVPAKGKISYASELVLTVTLADANRPEIVRPTEPVKAKIAASVDNPDVLKSYTTNDELVANSTVDMTQAISLGPKNQRVTGTDGGAAVLSLPSGGPYKYIVITSQSLKDATGPWNFQALCNAKNAKGIPATIVTTAWIYANYSGSNNRARIRNFLIDAYQNWGTEYVLLGGTIDIVPAMYFWVDALDGYDTTTMPVDMYYGCVSPSGCTFDYDGDGYYGEPTDGMGGGEVDLLAEIYVGRAPVANATEVANFVRKTLTYDLTQNQYLPRVAMLGEWLGFGGVSEYATAAMEQIRVGGSYDGYYTYGFENHNQNFFDFATSGCLQSICWPLYDASGYSWPNTNLLSLMNSGIHCFNHLGHGSETSCMKLYTSGLPSLVNDDYFFVYSQACRSGAFDTTDCFAEVITSMEHGAFGVVMNARYGWGEFDSTDGASQRFARHFWDAPLGEGKIEIGRANQDSKEDNVARIGLEYMRWCYYELNLFGDPQQELRFEDIFANATLMAAYNNQGNAVAWFDDMGNLVLSGTLSQQTSCTQTGISGQKIRASNGTVVAVINSGTGSMCITGSCYERQSSLNPSNAAYVAKDSSGNVVAYISTAGNLYLKGRVYESI